MTVQPINKEKLQEINFIKEDVFISENDKVTRKWKLDRALKLGNLFKHQVKVIFMNSEGCRLQTIATIWAVTEKYVILKGDRTIPIRSICALDEC